MNIIFLNLAADSDWGGGEQWTLYTAGGLAERGHTVSVIGRRGELMAERARQRGLKGMEVPVSMDYAPGSVLRFVHLFRNLRPDVLVVHHNKDVRTGGFAAGLLRIPVVHRNGFPILNRNLRHRLTAFLSNRILTNSQRIRDLYLGYGWFSADRIDVVPNGISPPEQYISRESVRNGWELEEDDLAAVYAGRLTSVKRVNDLLDVFRGLPERSAWKLIILGRGSEEEKLRNRALREGLTGKVKLLGYHENAANLLAAADLVVLPSSEEGMPNVLLEAMVRGVAVAASPVGDVPFLLNGGRAGRLVPVSDLAAWRELLNELESHPEELHSMAEMGKERVLSYFTMEKMLAGVENSLKKACGFPVSDG